jgi:hypothetical protein
MDGKKKERENIGIAHWERQRSLWLGNNAQLNSDHHCVQQHADSANSSLKAESSVDGPQINPEQFDQIYIRLCVQERVLKTPIPLKTLVAILWNAWQKEDWFPRAANEQK